MPCLGSKFELTGLSADEDRVNASVPNAKLDTAEIRRRALEARLSSFSLCRSAREIPSIRSGMTDRDVVDIEPVSESEVVENDATELNASERNSAVEVAAPMVPPAALCPGID